MKLDVVVDSYSTGGDPIDDGPWSSRTDEQTTVRSIEVVASENGEYDLDVSLGDDVYVVVVYYSTGDTFGNSYGEYKIYDVFDNAEQAYDLAGVIKGMTSPYSIETKKAVDTGWEFECNGKTYRKCWAGYFESFEGVSVEKLWVRKTPTRSY